MTPSHSPKRCDDPLRPQHVSSGLVGSEEPQVLFANLTGSIRLEFPVVVEQEFDDPVPQVPPSRFRAERIEEPA
jgi:hypothetical protein